jgi:hypothetical protein
VTTNATLERIRLIAEENVSLGQELESIVDRTWAQSGLIGRTPVRGDRSKYLKGLRERFASRISSEAESISVLTGMITSDVINWASSHGIPVERYEYPLGLLVAWVTLAALEKSKRDSGGSGSDKKSDT